MPNWFQKPKSTSEPNAVGSQPGVEVLSDDPKARPEDAPVTATVTPEEMDRQKNLGILLVNMGAADEEKVFGSKNSATMTAYRQQRSPDLLVIHRPEDDLPSHQVRWFKPWTWFSGGPRISPPRWGDVPRSRTSASEHGDPSAPGGRPAPAEGGEDAWENANATSSVDAERKAAIEAAVADRMREKQEDADAQKQGRRRRKRAGLPPVTFEPMDDKQVRDELTETVRGDREKLLESEKHIHEMLQGLEDTRFRYLVPSTDIKCEKEVIRVIQCYEKQNRVASQRLRDEAKARKAHNEMLPLALRASAEDEELAASRAVNFEVLACGDIVAALRRCADDMTLDYSKYEGVMKP